ncbi:MAG: hypothetical protein KKG00_03765 [Bacteroidetes bacterium]|nr:hypothetical protein [Bacteroidota bacterium]
MKELVTIVIPVLEKPYHDSELSTFKYYQKYLGDFPITFLKGESAGIPDGLSEVFPQADSMSFDSQYLHNQQTFTRLLLNPDLYEQFSWTRFLLIADPHTTIVKNELAYWCRQGYDLVQPIPAVPAELPVADLLLKRLNPLAFVQKYHPKAGDIVQTGGFSLRKVDTFAKYTKNKKRRIHTFFGNFPEAESDQLFWEYFINQFSPQLIVPNAISRRRFVQSTTAANEAPATEKPFAISN